MRLLEQPPEPGRLWVRYRPRPWPAPDGLWTDLAAVGLGQPGPPGATIPGPAGRAPLADDLLYLPPVEAGSAAARRALGRAAIDAGAPVLEQLLPGERPAIEGAVAVYDLLPALAAGELERLAQLPAGATAVWPLVAGVSGDPEVWEPGLRRLAEARCAAVLGLALQLAAGDRRRLAGNLDEERYRRLFHGPPPAERAFAWAAGRFGWGPFIERPLPAGPPWRRENRRLAGLLARAAELWLRLGRPESRGQELYRAARGVDRLDRDLATLAREGNLSVLPWLAPPARQLIEEATTGPKPALLHELETEYLS